MIIPVAPWKGCGHIVFIVRLCTFEVMRLSVCIATLICIFEGGHDFKTLHIWKYVVMVVVHRTGLGVISRRRAFS